MSLDVSNAGHSGPSDDALGVFARLGRTDRSLRVPDGAADALMAKRLAPRTFDQTTLFARMATQSPALFSDFPAPMTPSVARSNAPGDALVRQMANSDGQSRYLVRFGSHDSQQHLTISEIVRRWRVPGAVLGITDLPVRNTDLNTVFDPGFLAPWNLMPLASPAVQRLEMLTAVISTAGKLTDSHSDDMAVCNHCVTGSKLWLAWDTYDGLDSGLEDVERTKVANRAAFSLNDFLSIDSACWFLVGPGETVFLPGKFTHRVYTLENYIGVGSFYVGLPNLLHTASRWLRDGSLWDPDPNGGKGQLVDDLCAAAKDVLESFEGTDQNVSAAHGLATVAASLDHWSGAFAPDIRSHPILDDVATRLRRATEPSG